MPFSGEKISLVVCTFAQYTFQSKSWFACQRCHPRRWKLAVTTNLSKSERHSRGIGEGGAMSTGAPAPHASAPRV
jgi:hypothetical protein